MADNGSQPGTSAERRKIINNTLTENKIGNVIQNTTIYQSTTSTSSTHAPRRNPINNIELAVNTFIGRETELGDIKQLFHEYPVVVIAAMGGMGKTQLARKFASENADVYRDRYWINAETEEQLLKSFDRLAKKVKVDANTDIETVRDTYRSFTEGAALLIFDNVEHVNKVYKYLPTRIQLEDIKLHVLITSRWTQWTCDEQIECYKLRRMDISTSLQIFQRKFGETCIDTMPNEWKELAEMLGYLPLALQVATSYICKRHRHNSDLHTVLADYMKQLNEGADGLLNDPSADYDNRSVYKSMMLTLQQLENKVDNVSNVQNNFQWKFAVSIMNTVAYINPDFIEKKYLLKLVDNPENIDKLDEALEILTEYSLLNQRVDWRGATIYSVHRITQTSIRHNQTLMETADKYYTRLLKHAFTEDYFPCEVLQYANDRASAIADYYKNNPSPRILEYLVKNKAITAMEAVLKQISKKQSQIIIKTHDLLRQAVDSGCLSMTQLLWKYGADINQLCREGEWGEPPLHRALESKNVDIATWLLENGAAPSVRDRLGRNALHVAVERANHKMVPTIIKIIKIDRAVISETNNYGQTPLLAINYSENQEYTLSTTCVLLASGADMTAVDNFGSTVLHSVSRSACDAAVSLILQQNKDLINIVNKRGETALHVIPYDNTRIDDERILSTIRVLVESGGDLAKEDIQGNTVLHSAAKGARVEAVSLILQSNKDFINIQNKDGKTALHVLTNSQFPYMPKERRKQLCAETARVLIMNGLSLDTRDNKGRTPLEIVPPEYKDILLKVAEEYNDQLLVRPVKRQRTE